MITRHFMIGSFVIVMTSGGCRDDGRSQPTGHPAEGTHERRAPDKSNVSIAENLNLIRTHFSRDSPKYWSKEDIARVIASLDRSALVAAMDEVAHLKPHGYDDGFLDAGMLGLIDLGTSDDQLFEWLHKSSERSGLVRSLGKAMGVRARKSFPSFREHFEDDGLRDELTSSFYSEFSKLQPIAAMEAVLSYEGSDESISHNLAAVIGSMPADTDFEKVVGLISDPEKFHPSGDADQTLYWVLDRWSSCNPSTAADFAWEGKNHSDGFLRMITEYWADADPQPVRDWIEHHREISARFDEAVSGFIKARAEYDPGQCQEFASGIGDTERSRRCYEAIFETWSEYQPEEAAAAREAWLSRQ